VSDAAAVWALASLLLAVDLVAVLVDGWRTERARRRRR
jgi:hypothetical protein